MRVINDWQKALDRPSYDAEILDFQPNPSYRVVSFLKNGSGKVWHRQRNRENLNETLAKISADARLPIADHLRTARELHVHMENGIIVIKPSNRRHWTQASALNDADSALGDGFE